MTARQHQKLHNPEGDAHPNWKSNCIRRLPRVFRYLKYDTDDCPDCDGFKDKRAKRCRVCANKFGRGGKNLG